MCESIETALEEKKNYLGAENLANEVHLISEAPKQLAEKHVDCHDSCFTALLGEKLLEALHSHPKVSW